jgi:hypothetical protein
VHCAVKTCKHNFFSLLFFNIREKKATKIQKYFVCHTFYVIAITKKEKEIHLFSTGFILEKITSKMFVKIKYEASKQKQRKRKKKNRKHVAGSIGYILCWSETINIIIKSNQNEFCHCVFHIKIK